MGKRRSLSHCQAYRLVAIAFFSVALITSTEGRAGNAECLWQQLPEYVRTAAIDGYTANGKEGLRSAPVEDSMITHALAVCSPSSGGSVDLRFVGAALMGAALEHGARQSLAADGVDFQRVSLAWDTMTLEDRHAIFSGLEAPSADPKASAKLFEAFAHIAERAGIPQKRALNSTSDPTFSHLVDYFQGRAQHEQFQHRF